VALNGTCVQKCCVAGGYRTSEITASSAYVKMKGKATEKPNGKQLSNISLLTIKARLTLIGMEPGKEDN